MMPAKPKESSSGNTNPFEDGLNWPYVMKVGDLRKFLEIVESDGKVLQYLQQRAANNHPGHTNDNIKEAVAKWGEFKKQADLIQEKLKTPWNMPDGIISSLKIGYLVFKRSTLIPIWSAHTQNQTRLASEK
jgi:hypothetical protein